MTAHNKILAPLDGSPLARYSLSFLANFARSDGTEEVVLLRVVSGGESRSLRRANSYLQGLTCKLLHDPTHPWKEAVPAAPKLELLPRVLWGNRGPFGMVSGGTDCNPGLCTSTEPGMVSPTSNSLW